MSFSNRTSVSKYRRHQYSGPRKSQKRSNAAFRQHHGFQTNRVTEWRLKKNNTEMVVIQNEERQKCYKPINERPKLRTYPPATPRVCPNTNLSLETSSSVDPMPMDIDWAQLDTKIHERTSPKPEGIPYDNLKGLSGYRIVDIKHVLQWAFALAKHSLSCESSEIEYIGEDRDGFNSAITFQCTACGDMWLENTDKEHKLNTSFVWATKTAGSSYSQAAHITNSMSIPTMPESKFCDINSELSKLWSTHLTYEIKSAGEEERSIAIEKGHVSSDGIPYITVYVDDGRLNGSHGFTNNLCPGIACIMGKETKKCLYLGVKDKYCYTCEYYEQSNLDAEAHICCKNNKRSPKEIEREIIVEGFRQSENIHKLHFLKYIKEGDCKLYENLKNNVHYGDQIQKIDSKDSVLKNYTNSLHKIVCNTSLPDKGRNILKAKLKMLALAVRKILTCKSDQGHSISDDLRNIPLHVFGHHGKCQKYCCLKESNINNGEIAPTIITTAPEVWNLISAATETLALKADNVSNETLGITKHFMRAINEFSCRNRVKHRKFRPRQCVPISESSYRTGHKRRKTERKSQNAHIPERLKKYILLKRKNRLRLQTMLRKQLCARKEINSEKHCPDALNPLDEKMFPLDGMRQGEEPLLQLQTDSQEGSYNNLRLVDITKLRRNRSKKLTDFESVRNAKD